MSRDHKKLRVFHDANAVTIAIYTQTRQFPREEVFGLRAQMRRAAVSVPCNIVEGSARDSSRDYLKFLHIALASACELHYLVELSNELGLAPGSDWVELSGQCGTVVRQLQKLTEQVEALAIPGQRSARPVVRSP